MSLIFFIELAFHSCNMFFFFHLSKIARVEVIINFQRVVYYFENVDENFQLGQSSTGIQEIKIRIP